MITEMPSDTFDRLLIGRATEGDQMLAHNALRELESELSASQAREAAALEHIRQFDACIQAIAKSLGSPACGGVDVPVSDPHGTAGVLVAAVAGLREKLEAEIIKADETIKLLMERNSEHAKTIESMESVIRGLQITNALHGSEAAELRKLLEAKVPEEPTPEMIHCAASLHYGLPVKALRMLWVTMLSAAPQQSAKESPETDLDKALRHQ